MNAPPFPLNPTVGQWFGQWVWNGSRWVSGGSSGIRIMIQTFYAVGQSPYQPSPGLITAVVECIGAGGGGGGALGQVDDVAGSSGWALGGGGGSAGTYARSAIPAALVLGGVVVTIGAGGTPGPVTQNTTGGRGGTTSFGALVSAVGGLGGGSNVWNPSGPGAIAGGLDPMLGIGANPGIAGESNIADIGTWGNAGTAGITAYFDEASGVTTAQVIVFGGAGGGSVYGGTWAGVPQLGGGRAGQDGTNGAGGGGGASPFSNAPVLGGQGGSGMCFVTEYCWADAGDVTCVDPNLVNVNARVTVERDWREHGHRPRPSGGPSEAILDDPGPYGFDE
jgi:hypothetical protein